VRTHAKTTLNALWMSQTLLDACAKLASLVNSARQTLMNALWVAIKLALVVNALIK